MGFRVPALLAALCLNLGAQSSAIFIETIAGSATFDNRAARQTPLVQPEAVWVHPNGDIFISDGNFLVRRVRNGQATIVAGGGSVIDNSLPIPAKSVKLDYPNGLAGTATGALYISDVNHHRVQRLNVDGTIVTVAGKGTPGYSGDGGRATFAELRSPSALALSPTGDLFIADKGNSVVRKYNTQTGVITTYAGRGEYGYSGDGGQAVAAKLGTIYSLAVDTRGNLYICDVITDDDDDPVEARIRRITPDGIIRTYAGAGAVGSTGDNRAALSAKIGASYGLALDAFGNLYIADADTVRVVAAADGIIRAYAGQADTDNSGAENIPATEAWFNTPGAIALDADGNLYIPEYTGELVRRIDAKTKIITTIAGTSDPFDRTLAADAPINRPTSVATDKLGNIYIADVGHYRIRKIDSVTKIITTFAGDGKAAKAVGSTSNSLGGTLAISVDPLNRLLIADRYQRVVRSVDLNTGVMTTLVDLSEYSSQPTGVAGDALGNVYISDWNWDQVYRLSPDHTLYVAAGLEYDGTSDYSGDGGPADEAKLNGPTGLALDAKGRLLICDTGNHVVRVVDPGTFIITTFAGDGDDASNYDTYPAVEASLREPVALAVDSDGWVYIADKAANQVRVVTTDEKIYTAAGGNGPGYAGDGKPALLALLYAPTGVAASINGIYVSDSFNYRIRRLFAETVKNDPVVDPPRLSFHATQNGDEPSAQLLTVNSSYLGLNLYYTVDDSSGSWLYACTGTQSVDSCYEGTTPDLVGVAVDPTGLAPGKYTANLVISAQGSSDVNIPVDFTIDPENAVTSVKLSPPSVQYSLPQSSTSVQRIEVTSGKTELKWSIRRQTDSPWLKFSASSGSTPATVEASVDSAGLRPGTYAALSYFVVDGGATTLLITTVTVTDAKPVLQLDRDSMLFEAVEGTTAVPPQSLRIFNSGPAPLSWQIAIPAVDDQRRSVNWLRPSIAQATVPQGVSPSLVNIEVDPAGLRAGIYSVPILVTAPGAAGAPQVLGVRLRVLPAGTPARGVFDKTALLFVGSPGAQFEDQSVELSSTGGALSFTSAVRTNDGGSWLTVTPAAGSILSSAQRSQLRFQIAKTSLAAGVYRAAVKFSLSDGSVREVGVTLILRDGAGSSAAGSKSRSAACLPGKQVLVVSTLSDNFALNVGWPIPLQAQVYDDCGTPSATSAVNITFDNGDPVLVLKNLSGGLYSGTWTPSSAGSGAVSLSMVALRPGILNGEWKSTGRLTREASTPPILAAGGVLNAASRINTALLAPGGRLVLKGSNFPESAGDASVLIGGSIAKVVSSTDSEMQVVAPTQLDGLSQTYVLVNARGFSTSPQTVSVVAADPGLYPLPLGTSVVPGATLTLTATGLGAVDASGNVIAKVTAKVGDLDAVVTSATLPAGADGVYQVKITVPAGAAAGQPLTITQNGITSNVPASAGP